MAVEVKVVEAKTIYQTCWRGLNWRRGDHFAWQHTYRTSVALNTLAATLFADSLIIFVTHLSGAADTAKTFLHCYDNVIPDVRSNNIMRSALNRMPTCP